GQGLGRLGSTVAREGAQVALGGVMGAAGRATTDGNVTEGFLDGLASGVGSSVGGHAAKAGVARAEPLPLPGSETFRPVQTDPKLTAADIQLDADAAVRKTQAQGVVDDLKRAIASGTPDEQKEALKRVLENRDAKLLMKGAEVDAATKTAFADLTEQHRTKPVFAATADHLNQQKGTDGAQRFVVREPDPANPGGFLERKVLPTDFRSTSGTAGKAPGMDLDMTANATIIDRTTGRPARAADLDAAVGRACTRLGISKSGQEINLMHGESLERYTLRPGEDPAKFIPRVASGNVTGAEGRSLAEVTGAKLAEADVLHTGAGAVSEKCRIAAKDFDRITRPLMEAKSGSRLPPVFAVRDAVTGETPLDIMRAVANNDMPPGTGNARFRALTGMDLSAGADKLAQMPEFVAKFGATGSGAAAPDGPAPLLPAGEAARAALRQALRLGSDR
ncbi:MAG TPA: hypothetical protein PLQ11_08810, partial [Beijerinckiaceae bacterium]|nr:hypothetical protein [Beijerinckiaceae bacterium]